MKVGKYLLRILVYISGFFFFGLGTALSIKSTLGVTAVTSMPLALGSIAGFSVGVMMSLMALVYVVAQMFLLRKSFRLINIGQIAIGSAMGFLVDACGRGLVFFAPASYPEQFLTTLVSLPIISLGLSLIINANFLPSPSEGFSLVVAQKAGKPFPRVKVILDCITLALSLILLLAFGKEISGIREGTLINAVTIGFLIGLYNRLLKPFYAYINSKEPVPAQQSTNG